MQRAALPGSNIDFSSTDSTGGRWDPSRIKLLVANLVVNAAKYGEPSGVVTVRVQGDDAEVRLAVENSGATIPAEEIEGLSSRCGEARNAKGTGAALIWALGYS